MSMRNRFVARVHIIDAPDFSKLTLAANFKDPESAASHLGDQFHGAFVADPSATAARCDGVKTKCLIDRFRPTRHVFFSAKKSVGPTNPALQNPCAKSSDGARLDVALRARNTAQLDTAQSRITSRPAQFSSVNKLRSRQICRVQRRLRPAQCCF